MFVSLEIIAQLEEAAISGCLYSLAQLEQINSESSALCQCGSGIIVSACNERRYCSG